MEKHLAGMEQRLRGIREVMGEEETHSIPSCSHPVVLKSGQANSIDAAGMSSEFYLVLTSRQLIIDMYRMIAYHYPTKPTERATSLTSSLQ